MAVKKRKPTSPGRRFQTVSDFSEITRSRPEKSLLAPRPSKAGRNSHGRITSRHRGGGHKRRYRVIDFRRTKDEVPAKVAAIEYDPNRNARIALLHYVDGEKRYILAPVGVGVGDRITSGPKAEIRAGNALPLRNIPSGANVHAVEMRPGGGAKIARSAGSSVQLMSKEGGMALLRLPSGEMRVVPLDCRANDRTGGQHRGRAGEAGQGGAQSLEGCAPPNQGSGHEPSRPPTGRRRGQVIGRTDAGQPLGKAGGTYS